jgi:hypothetical protein
MDHSSRATEGREIPIEVPESIVASKIQKFEGIESLLPEYASTVVRSPAAEEGNTFNCTASDPMHYRTAAEAIAAGQVAAQSDVFEAIDSVDPEYPTNAVMLPTEDEVYILNITGSNPSDCRPAAHVDVEGRTAAQSFFSSSNVVSLTGSNTDAENKSSSVASGEVVVPCEVPMLVGRKPVIGAAPLTQMRGTHAPSEPRLRSKK